MENKAGWEQYKNEEYFFEQIFEAAPHKTVAVLSFISHHTKHLRKTFPRM